LSIKGKTSFNESSLSIIYSASSVHPNESGFLSNKKDYVGTILPTSEWKTTIFTNSTLPEYILENTPILSKQLISLFFDR